MQKHFSYLLSMTLVLALGVVVLGAYTRLSDAGLGCPDWPGCYGHLSVPETVNPDHYQRPLEANKAWKEMIHRYAAGTLGLLIVLIFGFVVLRGKQLHQSLFIPLLLLGTVIFQAMLGMWTVTHLLSPVIVTAHLLGGMTTLSLLWWLWLDRHVTQLPAFSSQSLGGIRFASVLALLSMILQIFLGGWTSSHYAAIACGIDFPTCQGQWWPPTDFANAFSFSWNPGVNYEFGTLENPARTAIHLTHRIGALVVVLWLGGLGLKLLTRPRSLVGLIPQVILGLLAIQVSLGIMNVVLALPLPIATAHTLGAALLLMAVLALNHRLFRIRTFY